LLVAYYWLYSYFCRNLNMVRLRIPMEFSERYWFKVPKMYRKTFSVHTSLSCNSSILMQLSHRTKWWTACWLCLPLPKVIILLQYARSERNLQQIAW